MENKKCAYLVDTPLQLLNAITHVVSHGLTTEADLFIVKQFKGAEAFAIKLSNTNIFRNIFVLDKEKKGMFKHFYTILGLVMPNIYCKTILKVNIKDKKYKALYFSAPTKMFDFIIAASGAKIIYGIEDGIGSYSGNIFRDYLSEKYVKIRWLLRNDYKIKKLYLRVPANYSGVYKNEIDSLYGEKQIDEVMIYDIFQYKKSELYIKNNFIYMNQPLMDFGKEHLVYEKQIIDEITKNLKLNCIARLHPREIKTDIYSQMQIDNEGNMWELICANDITENAYIVGMFSTAQFVPKYFYNKEPYIIFTFRLYKDLDSSVLKRYETQAMQLKDLYVNKEKIIIIDSINDIKKIIEKYNHKKISNGGS